MNNSVEYILCTAIKRRTPRQIPFNPYQCNDILNIEIGYRHCDIMLRFGNELLKSPSSQGFYTSHGRFVDRKEASDIAFKSSQINTSINILFSEDLY